jgi:uncharacterized protein (TIRG00374 family)
VIRKPSPRSALAALISIVSIAAVVHWAAGQAPPHLPQSGTGYLWLALAVVVTAGSLSVRAWRWHRIMRSAGVPHRGQDAAGLTVVGYMGNNVLPARGGEVLKIGLLGARSTARHREVLGTVLVERLLDAGLLVAVFAILTWADVAGLATMDGPAAIAATIVVALAAAGAVYLALRRRGRFERFAAAIRPVAGASRLLISRRGVPLGATTLVIWTLDAVTVLLAARSVGAELAVLPALAVLVLGSLAAAIPAAPGYVGTFDAAFLVGLHAASVKGGDAVSVLLMTRFVLFGPVTVAGLAVLVVGYRGLGGFRPSTKMPRRSARWPVPGRR